MSEGKCSIKECLCSCKTAKIVVAVVLAISFILSIYNFIAISRIGSKVQAQAVQAINENPKAILDSVQNYLIAQEEEANKERQAKLASISEKKSEIQNVGYSGVVNKNGKTTVVEFFDYNCGYCKRAAASLQKLGKEHKDVKIIYKDLPILGPASTYAARVAIAVNIVAPEKFSAFHDYLMIEGDARSESGVKAALEKAKIKFSTIENSLNKDSAKIDKTLADNMKLANEIGINGTPAFVIEDQLIPGAVEYESLVEIVKSKK